MAARRAGSVMPSATSDADAADADAVDAAAVDAVDAGDATDVACVRMPVLQTTMHATINASALTGFVTCVDALLSRKVSARGRAIVN